MSLGNYVTGSVLHFSASVPVPVSGTIIYANDIIEPVRTLADRTKNLSGSLTTLSTSVALDLRKAVGGILVSSSAGTSYLPAQDNFYAYDDWNRTHRASLNCTPDFNTNRITFTVPGYYSVKTEMSFRSDFATTKDHFDFRYLQNGVQFQSGTFARVSILAETVATANDARVYNMSLTDTLVVSASGEYVELAVRAVVSGTDPMIVYYASMLAEKIN